MKKLKIYGVVLLSVGLLAACSAKKENTDVTKELQALRKSVTTTSEVGTETTNSETKETVTASFTNPSIEKSAEYKDKERYEKVFVGYRKIFDFANSGKTTSDSEYSSFVTEMQAEMDYWIIESALRDPDNQRYAFYDVDNNGISEMLVGSLSTDGTVFALGFYYWDGNAPVLLSVARAGGGRSGFTIYSDGTILSIAWTSGTGEGRATLYQLPKENGPAINLDIRDVKIGVDDFNVLFGKSEEMQVDVNQLKWNKFATSTVSTLAKDTKNLTTQEVTDWVWRNFSAGMETPDYSFYTDQGWSVDVWENRDDHLVYATILDENEEIIWEFRVNAEGHLQTNKGYGSGIEHEWRTVAEDFADNGKW